MLKRPTCHTIRKNHLKNVPQTRVHETILAQSLSSRAPDSGLITKVAIVEDSSTFRQYLADLIRAAPDHACVCACASAEEALAAIPLQRPDVVLMDIHLPGESGIVCTARLREKMPDLQVIMLTVYKDIKTIFEALKAGACGYVLKRADETEILLAIAEVRAGGAPMTSEIARLVVRSFMEPPTAPPSEIEPLTARETELLALLAEGLSNKEIGAQLQISSATVRTHLMHIYEKLHVRCRTEAAGKYLRQLHPAVAGAIALTGLILTCFPLAPCP
jgi:DNA-binding NarL/FixJ family response regulator